MVVINRSLRPVASNQLEEYYPTEPSWFLMDAGAIYAPSISGMKYGNFNNVKLPKSYKEGGQHIVEYTLTPSNVNYLFEYLEKIAYTFSFINNGVITKINNVTEFNSVYSTLEQLLGTQGYIDIMWYEEMCLNGDSETVTNIWPNAFKHFTQLSGKLTIPNTYKSIGSLAFYACLGLTSIELPEGLKSIGDSAFNGCSGLSGELILPSTITSIGNAAFYGCRGITTIKLEAKSPPTLSNETALPDTVTKIYIPAGTLEAYQSATNWSALANLLDDGSVQDNTGTDPGWDDEWNNDWGI